MNLTPRNSQMLLMSYDYAPTPPSDMLRDVDPDEQFLNDVFPTYSNSTHSPYYSLECYNNEFRSASLSFNVLHMNVRSLNANGDLFSSFLNALYKTPDVFVMTETWLAEVSLELGTFDGYNFFPVVRNDAQRGVASMCVDGQYHASKIENLCTTNENIEACVVTVNSEGFGVVVVCIYRPPAGNVEIFNDLLSRILNDDSVVNRNFILIGDINVNLLDLVVSTDQYVSLTQSLNFCRIYRDQHAFHFVTLGLLLL